MEILIIAAIFIGLIFALGKKSANSSEQTEEDQLTRGWPGHNNW